MRKNSSQVEEAARILRTLAEQLLEERSPSKKEPSTKRTSKKPKMNAAQKAWASRTPAQRREWIKRMREGRKSRK